MPAPDVYLYVQYPPDVPGFDDRVQVVRNGVVEYACPARRAPNHVTPWHKGSRPWHEVYDCIAFGQYRYKAVSKLRYGGLCLLLNGGGEVRSCNPRPNLDGSVFTEVFVHPAASHVWPGSRGCPTIQPLYWPGFRAQFEPGDVGSFYVVDHIGEGWLL